MLYHDFASFLCVVDTLIQVFKFDQEGDDSPSMTLGTAFAPGTGRQHFCKPAAVAVESSGIFYIADG